MDLHGKNKEMKGFVYVCYAEKNKQRFNMEIDIQPLHVMSSFLKPTLDDHMSRTEYQKKSNKDETHIYSKDLAACLVNVRANIQSCPNEFVLMAFLKKITLTMLFFT